MSFLQDWQTTWRDYIIDGVPSSGKYNPEKSRVRDLGADLDSILTQVRTGTVVDVRQFANIDGTGSNSFDSGPGLNAAIAAVNAAGGGTIGFPSGFDCRLKTPILMKNGVFLRGAEAVDTRAAHSAILRPSANLPALITQADLTTILHSAGIIGMVLDGRRGTYNVANLIDLSPVNSRIENCQVQNGSGTGIYLRRNPTAAWINWISNNSVNENGAWGMRLEVSDSVVSNNYVSDNGTPTANSTGHIPGAGTGGGIWVKGNGNVRIVGNQIELEDIGLLYEGPDDTAIVFGGIVSGNFFDHNNVALRIKKGSYGTTLPFASPIVGNQFNLANVCDIDIQTGVSNGIIIGNSHAGSGIVGSKNIVFGSGATNPGWQIIGDALSEPVYSGYDISNAPADLIVIGTSAGSPRFDISALNWKGTTASSATGGVAALPANPQGYLVISVGGFDKRIPYYGP